MVQKAERADSGESSRFKFTRERVDSKRCPPERSQALYWDTEQPGLGLRVTANGARSFIFEAKLGRQTIRMTIGPATMRIRAARDRQGRPVTEGADIEAARLGALIAQGRDPRIEKATSIAQGAAQQAAARTERKRLEVTGLEAWAAYCRDRQRAWGARNHAEHVTYAAGGGVPRKRARGETQPGALHALLAMPLASIDAKAVEAWATREAHKRAATAQLGFRMLRAFVNWCADHPDYRALVNGDACKGKRVRERLGTPKAKDDALQREQLPTWFSAVRACGNPAAAAYLQALLLTGARREEMLSLTWDAVDFQWRSLRIRDKVEGERTIPLTPYVAQLLSFLPKRQANPWVFSSPLSKDGRLQEPRRIHNRALHVAGLPHVTLHGLRRSFGTLAEWVEVPVGIVAQIQGHKPSALAEKHYRVRPLDLLRMWHERIEAWILKQAGVAVPAPATEAKGLRVVASA
ncbi:MAG: integrase family protein [Burkholderiales bacterium]